MALEDLHGKMVAPAVENPTEEVNIRIMDRLWIEEVVRHEGNSVSQILWGLAMVDACKSLLKVSVHDLEIRVDFGKNHANEANSTANLSK
jgi:hypothetical protein